MSEINRKFDEEGNIIYAKYADGGIYYYEYNKNGKVIHSRSPNEGNEQWYKFDKNNKHIEITQKEFEQIKTDKEQKEFLSREEVSIFELMDI